MFPAWPELLREMLLDHCPFARRTLNWSRQTHNHMQASSGLAADLSVLALNRMLEVNECDGVLLAFIKYFYVLGELST